MHNHRKREEKKAQSKAQAQSRVNQYYGIGAVLAVGVIGGLGYYIYQTKKGEVVPLNLTVSQQPRCQTNKFEMD